MSSKSAISKMLAGIIIAIIVIAAIAGAAYYWGTQISPSPSPSPSPTDLKTLTIASYFEPISIDPCHSLSGALACITRNTYEGLVQFNGSGTTENDIIPSLATSWELVGNDKIYRFTLRQGVKYHDGTSFNASTAKFGIDRMLAYKGGPAGYFTQINRTVVVDDYTIEIVLKEPSATVLKHLATFFGYVFVSPTAVAAHNSTDDPLAKTWFMSNVVGTGPYKLQEWIRESKVVLTKFNDYWGGWAGKHVETVVLLKVAEASTQKLMLAKGDVDIAEQVDVIDQLTLNATEGIDLVLSERYSSGFYALFTVAEGHPLADVRLRQAILYGLNYDVYWKNIVMGLGQRALSLFGSFQTPYWTGDFGYTRNVTKAKELLAEAGYGPNNHLQLKATYATANEFRRKIFEQMRTDLLEVGIEVTIIPALTQVVFNEVASGIYNYDLADQGLYGCSDPDYAVSNLFPSWMWPPAAWNLGAYNNTEFDNLVLEERGATNITRRAEIFYRLQQIGMVEDPPAVMFLEMPEEMSRLQRTWVHGRYYNPANWRTIDAYRVWKEV